MESVDKVILSSEELINKFWVNPIVEVLLMDPIVFQKWSEIEKWFRWLYEWIVVIWSFAVWEYTKNSSMKYHSDIDFYVLLKDWVKQSDVLHVVKKLYHTLNWEKLQENTDPSVSIWVKEYNDFYSKQWDDTLVPYQIKETWTILYWHVNKDNLTNKIEFNSHIWLCGVWYMQLLKWIEYNNIVDLTKAVFNQIWSYLISKSDYKTSYFARIQYFLEYFPQFEHLREDLLYLHEIKKSWDNVLFEQKIWNTNDFLVKFEELFSFSSLKEIFNLSWSVEEVCDALTKDNDTHKFIRVAYFCFYFNDMALSKKYLDIACKQLNYTVSWQYWLESINTVQQIRVKSIWVFD